MRNECQQSNPKSLNPVQDFKPGHLQHAPLTLRSSSPDPRPCVVCGKLFEPAAPNARKCSNACRRMKDAKRYQARIEAARG